MLDLRPGEEALVFITHDESTFNANDGKRKIWKEEGKNPIRPKNRGKGIMVSAFCTPGGILRIPDGVSNAELQLNPTWPMKSGVPVREAVEYLEYGKDNYWTGEKLVKQVVDVALPIFRYAFPGCRGLWAFDNATNHSSYHPQALVASRMNLSPGGGQARMREGFDHNRQLPQAMIFTDNHKDFELRGKPKGVQHVLQERGLWRYWRSDGGRFLLECPTSKGRTGCPDVMPEGGCCGRRLLSEQRDFCEQKGWLEQELEMAHQELIFYPKFHCELNFIERFWCSAKYYTRENCQYSLEGLREVVPAAMRHVSPASINRYYNHCSRTIDAYASGHDYGTKAFKEQVYKGHRQVTDKTKW